jgi:hypothetical protein
MTQLGKEIAKLMDKHGIAPAKPAFWIELEEALEAALQSALSHTDGDPEIANGEWPNVDYKGDAV